MAFLFIVFLSSCKKEEITQTPESSKNPSSSARASGLLGNGVNIQPSYYNNGTGNIGDIGWDNMKTYTKIKVVRIEIEPDKVTQGARWIREAVDNGFQVIATYHESDRLGQTNDELEKAADWWVTNYNTLTTNRTKRIIINIINEWGGKEISASEYARRYNAAINRVRTGVSYSGLMVVDLPGYGQGARVAAEAIRSHGLTTSNIIFSAHIYQNAYDEGRGWFSTASIDDLDNTGARCMVGEFGVRYMANATGTDLRREQNNTVYVYRVDPTPIPNVGSAQNYINTMINHAKSKGWSVLGWAWNGDGIGMNMVYPDWSKPSGINNMADTRITDWNAINYVKAENTGTSITRSNYFKTIYDLL